MSTLRDSKINGATSIRKAKPTRGEMSSHSAEGARLAPRSCKPQLLLGLNICPAANPPRDLAQMGPSARFRVEDKCKIWGLWERTHKKTFHEPNYKLMVSSEPNTETVANERFELTA